MIAISPELIIGSFFTSYMVGYFTGIGLLAFKQFMEKI